MPEIITEAQLDELLNSEKLQDHIEGQVNERLGKVVEEQLATVLGKNGIKRVPMGDDGAIADDDLPDPLDFDDLPEDSDPYRKMGVISRGNAKSIMRRYRNRTPAAKAYGKGDFKHLGDFLTATFQAGHRGQPADSVGLKALGEGGGAEGGFLVPEDFRAELLMLALEDSIVRPRARIFPMSRESMTFPMIKESTRATNVFGGVQAFWNAEAADLSSDASQPAFGRATYNAHKLTGYTVASNELLADSAIGLEAVILSMFGPALGFFEDISFIEGTGAGQPLGIKDSNPLITVAKETGQAATTMVTENFDKMFMRMLPQSRGRAVWAMHYDVIPQLLALSRAVGTGGAPVMMMNIANAPVFTIYGRPVLFTEKCQTLGTLGDVYFADFSYYTIGDRQALEMATSMHVKFTTDEIVWRFIQRVDGRPWLTSALTPRNGSTTISPFVTLAART